jgi:hypothetical protein
MTGSESLWGLTPHEIYTQLHGGPGTASIHEAQMASVLIRRNQWERADRIIALSQKIANGWQGEAAEGAYGATQPLANQAVNSSQRLYLAQHILDRQGEAFEYAKNSVVPVPANAPESNIMNDVIPWETDLDAAIKKYQADAQHNIDIFNEYDGQSYDNEIDMPLDYGQVMDTGGEITVIPSGGTRLGGGSGDGEHGLSEPYRPSSADGGGNQPPPGGGGQQQQPLLPGGGGHQPTPAGRSLPEPPESTNPGGWSDTRPPDGSIPGGGPNPGSGQGTGGGVGTGGGAGYGPGFAPGYGAGGGAAGGSTRGERGGLRQGPGGRMGGIPPGEGFAGRGGTGARGAAGVPGMGMGAGRGKGEDDYEHERASYLEEPDPEATFGDDRMTSPPVIGE